MNLNKLAKDLTISEGLKHQVNIGDMKEILRKLFTEYDIVDIFHIWVKYNR